MLESLFTLGRLIVVLTFVLLMPVLATPGILDRVDNWLYGERSKMAAPPLDLWIRQSLSYFAGHDGNTEHDNAKFHELLEITDVWKDADHVATASEFAGASGTHAARHRGTDTACLSDESRTAKTGDPLEPPHLPKAAFRQSLTTTIPPHSESVPMSEEVELQDRLRWLQRQLEQMGARYMLLEEISSDPVSFRCTCDVQISESAAYTRRFEAERATPLAAVEAVLRDVQQWHAASRRQPTSHR